MLNQLTASELIRKTREKLIQIGYSACTMKVIERVWRNLEEYIHDKGMEYFSLDLGMKFLEEKFGITATQKLSELGKDQIRAVNLLEDYQQQRTPSIRKRSKTYVLSPQFKEVFQGFIDFKISSGLSKRTTENYLIYLERFSEYLDNHKITSITEVKASHIVDFINSCGAVFRTATIYCTSCMLRVLFKYLYDKKIVTINLAPFVPSVKYNKKSKVPSAYSADEVQKLLASVDRGNPKGKRDYAMMLIAVRIGLRASDICELTFDNFKWELNSIELVQGKTGEPIVLPLFNDVGEAVIDYIKFGRPSDKTSFVFLRHSLPTGRLMAPTLHSIVTYYMRKANIAIQEGKKHGPHSLRHSLASALLDMDTPMPVISEILGHTNSDTTSVYLKIDILHMREYSLEVPPVSFDWFGGGF